MMTCHYPDLGTDVSSVQNICYHLSDIVLYWKLNGGCFAKCHLFSLVNGLLITVLQWTIAFHTEVKIGSQENLLRGVYFES